MKKLIVLAVLLFTTVTVSAQKRFEDGAKATVKEMSEVIKLSQEQSDKLYANELDYNIKKAKARQDNADNQEKFQEEMKVINKESTNVIKEIIGASDMKTYFDYKKAQRAKK